MESDLEWNPMYIGARLCDHCLHHVNCHYINEQGETCCTACGGGKCRRTTNERIDGKVVPT